MPRLPRSGTWTSVFIVICFTLCFSMMCLGVWKAAELFIALLPAHP